MTNINLLPWRERITEERARQFYFSLACTGVLVAIIIFVTHLSINYRISSQQLRNTFLNTQISALDVKIREIKALEKTKESILDRISIIQDLQSERMLIVHLFDEIVNILPKGLHLTEIQRKGSTVLLFGKTESNSTVSDLMRNINKSHWLSSAELREIKSDPENDDRFSEFSLRLVLANPYLDKDIKTKYATKEIKPK